MTKNNKNMTKSDQKVLNALKCSEEWVKEAERKGIKETFKMGNGIGFTSLWCEKRNIKEYKEMIGKDKRKLKAGLRELYRAI